ncbi:MAG: Murein hydrolase activator EnvC [Bacteroidia bacterium]|nr:Murein hydrolase activator EnvC [Bacteroidia bacterium]
MKRKSSFFSPQRRRGAKGLFFSAPLLLCGKFLFFVFCCLLLATSGFAQTAKELEEKKKQLQEDIKYTNKLISETESSKKNSLSQLRLLNTKIEMRQELIKTIAKEVRLIDKQINQTNSVVGSLENDLKKLKAEYAQMIYFAWKNQNAYSKLMFIFSSKDFNQAYLRLKYIQQYADYRKKQAKIIKDTQLALGEKIDVLKKSRTEKATLLTNEEQEKLKLTTEKKEKDDLLEKLQNREAQLKKELKQKQTEAQKLQKEIERIIAEEIKKREEEARKKAAADKAAGKEVKETPKGFAMTPEEMLISDNFEINKGKLPWPSDRGIITGHFGESTHPDLPNVKINNNGIDIGTDRGAKARAVFDGTVSAIISIPGAYKAVMVRHGDFISVYANLEEVYVKKDDKIKVKQEIGKVHTDETEGKTELHFEIWKGNAKTNPEEWILLKK